MASNDEPIGDDSVQVSRSEFLSQMSHELRTPLTAIRGALQMLSRPKVTTDSPIGKEMIQIMKRSSERLERLVMDLVAVSQLEAGDVGVSPEEIDLAALVRSRVDSILFDHPQVEVSGQGPVMVRADRERLGQAVEHVLDNARKFGPESGAIRIEIAQEDGFARLSVTDEGPGIAKSDRDRIFRRFVRLHHAPPRETKGSGIGLFIAKRSIEAMGGSIEVDSAPNRGATFHLRIPSAQPVVPIDPGSSA